jgi:RNAse (barnase) inhibitor barstar
MSPGPSWSDLARRLPGLRGARLHVIDAAREDEVLGALQAEGFDVRILDGASIADEASFFVEAERGLGLPAHFGRNWDALNDCLGDWLTADPRRVAVVWREADRSLESDPQTVFQAVLAFDAVALAGPIDASDVPPLQLVVFLLGRAQGFRSRV